MRLPPVTGGPSSTPIDRKNCGDPRGYKRSIRCSMRFSTGIRFRITRTTSDVATTVAPITIQRFFVQAIVSFAPPAAKPLSLRLDCAFRLDPCHAGAAYRKERRRSVRTLPRIAHRAVHVRFDIEGPAVTINGAAAPPAPPASESALAPLRHRGFLMLWLVWSVANLSMAMSDIS